MTTTYYDYILKLLGQFFSPVLWFFIGYYIAKDNMKPKSDTKGVR